MNGQDRVFHGVLACVRGWWVMRKNNSNAVGPFTTEDEARKALARGDAGFTLIELLIVVAIIGILAAIAIPQYQTFVTRGKVSELLTAVSACKSSVSEYRMTQATWPADIDAAGCSDQQTKYVSTLKVGANGVITATALTGANAIDPAAAGDLELRPTLTAGGEIDWSCKGVGTTIPQVPARELPAMSLALKHPQAGAAWQCDTHSYVSDDLPGLRVYQMSRHSSEWIVSIGGEYLGTVYHVIPRNWVTVMDADGDWIASVRGGFDGREDAIRLLVTRAEGKT